MKFFRLDLLTLLISLFILSSCKKQGTVNLGVNDETLIEGKLIDTSTVFINTVREDSAFTSGMARTPLSYFKDPIFGITESNIAMDLNLPFNTAVYFAYRHYYNRLGRIDFTFTPTVFTATL